MFSGPCLIAFLHVFLCTYPSLVLSARTGDSTCNELLCLNATLQGDMLHYQITDMHTEEKDEMGYVGVGFGKRMTKSPMVILWPTSNGSITLSQRYAMSHSEPNPSHNPPSIATVSDPISVSWLTDNRTTMSFAIPVHEKLFKNASAVEMIWAYGRRRPTPEDDPNAHLWFHYKTGHVVLDLTKQLDQEQLDNSLPGAESGASTDSGSTTLAAIHGILLSLGFLVILPFGSLVGRYARSFTVGWFPIHQLCQMWIAGPVILLGWLLGPFSVFQRNSEHLLDVHQTFGFVLFGLYCAQVWLGRYIHRRRTEGRVKVAHPPLNIFHVTLGLSILALAFAQVRTGITKFEYISYSTANWRHFVFNGWAVIIPLAYLLGLVLLPRQFRREKEMATSPPPPAHYTPLSANDEEPLLYTIGTDDDAEIEPKA
ncbi:hypothetical protein DL96DRAFT_1577712 [Flagelloscypha sp. PMI_526]|nr:hypothetical protein DL96DRAFT_1577712 [Flagelloscypha sp. PMI_526]